MYEIQAWFAFAGSMEIADTNLPGAAVVSSSSRVKLTELAGSASAFFEMHDAAGLRRRPERDRVGRARSTAVT